jgi:hypothetical protein
MATKIIELYLVENFMKKEDNVVFILGAGASKSCGAPLMNNFLDVASRLFSEGKVPKEEEHFVSVFKAISKLQQVHSKAQLDLTNIESIYTTFEIGQILSKLPDLNKEDIPQLIKSLKILIYRTLEESILFNLEDRSILPPADYLAFTELIKSIYQMTPKKNVSIITFNYDIALDYSLYRNDLLPYYGFEKTKNYNNIPLYKLHGSLNWAIKKENNEIIPLNLNEYFSKYSVQFSHSKNIKIPIASQLVEYFKKLSVDVEDTPVIIPPSWNKSEHQMMIKPVWENAAKDLENSEYIFIIGYSMPETDSFFRLLYALGTVGDVMLKKLRVINPDNSIDTKNRFKSIFGPAALARYDYIENKFEDCSNIIKSLLD